MGIEQTSPHAFRIASVSGTTSAVGWVSRSRATWRWATRRRCCNETIERLDGERALREWEQQRILMAPECQKLSERMYGKEAPKSDPPLTGSQLRFYRDILVQEWKNILQPPPAGIPDEEWFSAFSPEQLNEARTRLEPERRRQRRMTSQRRSARMRQSARRSAISTTGLTTTPPIRPCVPSLTKSRMRRTASARPRARSVSARPARRVARPTRREAARAHHQGNAVCRLGRDSGAPQRG